MVSTRRKKSPNQRMLFQVDRKSVSWSGEFVEEYVSTRRKNGLVGISEKSKKIIVNSYDKSFK